MIPFGIQDEIINLELENGAEGTIRMVFPPKQAYIQDYLNGLLLIILGLLLVFLYGKIDWCSSPADRYMVDIEYS